MEGYDYKAAASTVKIKDITIDETNRKILRRLKENDPRFKTVIVSNKRGERSCDNNYCSGSAYDLGWLGYFVGGNTCLKKLHLQEDPFRDFSYNGIESFFSGVNRNRSIQEIRFCQMDLPGRGIFPSLSPFLEGNHNLSQLGVACCRFGAGSARQLSSMLRGCDRSLKSVALTNNQIGGEQLADVIEALSTHTQLEELGFWWAAIGRNECTALAALLRMTPELQTLNLNGNDIDDEGVDALAGALTSNLRKLILSCNPNITARGCDSLAGLLEHSNCNLEELCLTNNNTGDEGALIFANALAKNSKLKILDLYGSGITAEGWSCFSKVLCDTSSINNTFLSNHTLTSLGVNLSSLPPDVRALMALNSGTDNKKQISLRIKRDRSSEDKKQVDKKQVAIKKILKHHQHFDMEPFFEWDLKVLPIAVNWFDRARSIDLNDEARIVKLKLNAIYQFIHAMPEVFELAPGAGDKRKRSVFSNQEN